MDPLTLVGRAFLAFLSTAGRVVIHHGKIIWAGPVADVDRSDNLYVDQFIHGHAEGPIQMAVSDA